MPFTLNCFPLSHFWYRFPLGNSFLLSHKPDGHLLKSHYFHLYPSHFQQVGVWPICTNHRCPSSSTRDWLQGCAHYPSRVIWKFSLGMICKWGEEASFLLSKQLYAMGPRHWGFPQGIFSPKCRGQARQQFGFYALVPAFLLSVLRAATTPYSSIRANKFLNCSNWLGKILSHATNGSLTCILREY